MTDPTERALQEQGKDANTRDAEGRRYGGETLEGAKLGRHPTFLIWFTMFVIVAGFTVAGVAIIVDSLTLFIIGSVIVVIGGIAALAAGVMDTVE